MFINRQRFIHHMSWNGFVSRSICKNLLNKMKFLCKWGQTGPLFCLSNSVYSFAQFCWGWTLSIQKGELQRAMNECIIQLLTSSDVCEKGKCLQDFYSIIYYKEVFPFTRTRFSVNSLCHISTRLPHVVSYLNFALLCLALIIWDTNHLWLETFILKLNVLTEQHPIKSDLLQFVSQRQF